MNETATIAQTEELSPEVRDNWKTDIAEGIDLLSEQEKLVIALLYHEELTTEETSLVLEIPEKEVEKIRDATLEILLNR
jgi:DNA-directed RNA polymerase specialized sigma subunit